jgi:hypothetical protein
MRVTRVAVIPSCAICERTLLMGERAIRFAPAEGEELVDVCPLCQEVAIEYGWLREGTPTTPMVPDERRRRRRGGLAAFLGISRSSTSETVAPAPILRRLSGEELAIVEAADLFNASAYRRTVGGIARSLGDAKVSVVALSGAAGELAISVAWELSWYQYRANPHAPDPVRLEDRGAELEELADMYCAWNAEVDAQGRLSSEPRVATSR